MKRIIIQLIFLLIPLCTPAQGNLPLLPLPVLELLQYQVQKGKRAVAPYLFSKYGLRRIPAELVVDESRQLWGWHVGPNTDFDQSKHPFYRLFTKKDNSSLAVIDDRGGALQIVFWDKGIIIRWCLVFGRMATSYSKSNQRLMFFVFSVRAVL